MWGAALTVKIKVTIQRGFTGVQEFPALVKAGWLRPSRNRREATLAGHRRSGWFKHPNRFQRWFERTAPSALAAGAFGDILLTARPPRLNQGGEYLAFLQHAE